jgi:hypothetical protein
VLRSTPGALDIVADLARRGRKLAISIILLSQDTQAETLGIEGQTRLLDAFDRLDCKMTPVGVELPKDGVVQQGALLDYHLTDLVLPVIDELRPSTPDADRLLEKALAEPVPEQKRGASAATLPHSTGTGSSRYRRGTRRF